MDIPIPPSAVVQQTLGVRLLGFLGGRLNHHWLVEANHTHMVLRCWYQSPASIAYELLLMTRLAAMGWPVALPVEAPVEVEGYVWSLAPFLPGDPPAQDDPIAEQRARGRLLATLHTDLAQLPESGQREGWRRCEEILADSELDHVMTLHEKVHPEEIRILRWHLERARERIRGLAPYKMPGQIVHGDFTTWNLRFANGRLSGILDFELAHWDHRVGDFALSWRGKYDEVIYGLCRSVAVGAARMGAAYPAVVGKSYLWSLSGYAERNPRRWVDDPKIIAAFRVDGARCSGVPVMAEADMKQEQQTSKRIVSRGEFFGAVLHQLCLIVTGFLGIIIGGVLCGGVPVCLFYILREFHFDGLLVVGTLLLVSLSVSIGWRLIRKSEQRFYVAQDMDTGIPLTRANAADLPAPDSLVRASQEPVQAQEGVLLRAATGDAQEGQEEQLLRASAGK